MLINTVIFIQYYEGTNYQNMKKLGSMNDQLPVARNKEFEVDN